MPTEGMCEGCPGREKYSLKDKPGTDPNVPATLCFYEARREWDPIRQSDEKIRATGCVALRYIGVNEEVESVLDLSEAVDDGVHCASIFYKRGCSPKVDDDEWMEANDYHNPKTNPRLLDIITSDYWHS